MGMKSVLDEASVRRIVVTALRAHGTLSAAAAEVGTSRRAITKARERFPAFDRDCTLALGGALPADPRELAKHLAGDRARIVRDHLAGDRAPPSSPAAPPPRPPVGDVMDVEVVDAEPAEPFSDHNDGALPTTDAVLRWSWRAARDPGEHPAVRVKCAQNVFAATAGVEVFERRLTMDIPAGGSGGGTRVVVVDLPRKSTAPASGDVVDAEVVG